MKTIILSTLMATCSILTNAQSSEVKKIKETILNFSKAGDSFNISDLENYLDANYRIVMNRLFGSNEVSIMTKELYLEKIRNKEYGGDTREVTFGTITINGNTATAKVTFKGSKLSFISLISLIKDAEGKWKLICDIPTIL